MNWDTFLFFGMASIIFGLAATFSIFIKNDTKWCIGFTTAQIAVLALFIVGFWISIERPPFKTMGETRLWFSFFMPVAALFTYSVWKYKYVIAYGTVLSTVFILINILKPEMHSKELMPALQSPYFIPHVAIYMLAYAFMGGSFVLGIAYLFKNNDKIFPIINHLVLIGIVGLGIGMIVGSLWAKEAWGTFWSWDPKETWALATWLCYFMYYYLQKEFPHRKKIAITILIIAFLSLQICWVGVNYLPSASSSVHAY